METAQIVLQELLHLFDPRANSVSIDVEQSSRRSELGVAAEPGLESEQQLGPLLGIVSNNLRQGCLRDFARIGVCKECEYALLRYFREFDDVLPTLSCTLECPRRLIDGIANHPVGGRV